MLVNMFVGIKRTGTFQHSSLLSGGGACFIFCPDLLIHHLNPVVTSAGLISVKDGVIHTLSPLSGHYRTSIDVSSLIPQSYLNPPRSLSAPSISINSSTFCASVGWI